MKVKINIRILRVTFTHLYPTMRLIVRCVLIPSIHLRLKSIFSYRTVARNVFKSLEARIASIPIDYIEFATCFVTLSTTRQ